MVEVGDMFIIIIGLAVSAIIIGTVFLVGVGTLANQTAGNACKNCQAVTKTLLQNTEVFLVISIAIVIIFGALAYAKIKK